MKRKGRRAFDITLTCSFFCLCVRAMREQVAAAAQARKKKAEAIAAAACAVSATSSTGDTPAASSCKRRSGHVKLFASASSPPLVDAASSQSLSLLMPTAKRARREQAAADGKEDEFESASSAAASVHERCAKRRRRSSSNAADTPPRQEGSESEGEEEEELMSEDASGIETASSGAEAAAAASSTPVAAVEADPADSMIMQLIDIADDASRSGVFAAVLELSEQRSDSKRPPDRSFVVGSAMLSYRCSFTLHIRMAIASPCCFSLAHIINLQSSKDGSTFLQRLYRCFALRHSQSIHAHMAKLTRVIKKHADWSLTDEHHSTLLHTLSDAATYQYKTRHWNRNRYRWIDNHMVLQPDEPEYVFRDHDENRSRGFTFDLIRIACDNKLDLTSADDKGQSHSSSRVKTGSIWAMFQFSHSHLICAMPVCTGRRDSSDELSASGAGEQDQREQVLSAALVAAALRLALPRRRRTHPAARFPLEIESAVLPSLPSSTPIHRQAGIGQAAAAPA